MPLKNDLAPEELLAYERFSYEAKLGYNQTEHPNALPATWHCSGQHKDVVGSSSLSTSGSLSVRDATLPVMSLASIMQHSLHHNNSNCSLFFNRRDDDGGDVGFGGGEFAVAFGGRADGGEFVVAQGVGEAPKPPAGKGHGGGGERQD